MEQLNMKPTYEELQQRVAELEQALANRSGDHEKIGKLEEQNRIFEAVVSQSPAAILITNEKGIIRYVNEKFTSTIAEAPEGKVGEFMLSLLADESKSAIYDDLIKAVQTGQIWRGELKIARKDARIIWLSIIIFPLFQEGVLKNYVGILNDISLLKNLQTSTLEKDGIYRTLIENLPLAIAIYDKKGRFIFANPQTERLTNNQEGGVAGKTFYQVFPKGTADEQMKSMREIFKSGRQIITERLVDWEDHVIRIKIILQPLFNANNEITSVLSIGSDITEQSRKEQLLNIQHKIDSLSNLSTDLKYSLNLVFKYLKPLNWIDGGGIYQMNDTKDGLELIFARGLSKKFIKRVSFIPFTHIHAKALLEKKPVYLSGNDFLLRPSQEMIDEGIRLVAIIPLIYKDELIGCINLASLKTNTIDDFDKVIVESVASRLADLIMLVKTQVQLDKSNYVLNTQLKELSIKQQLLIQKSRLESLGELSAGLAHEINQPLTVISLVMENLNYKIRQQQASGDYIAGKFETISNNINKIKLLIDHVRIFSRDQGSITFERVDVNQGIINALSMIESQLKHYQIDVITNLSDKIGHTVGNPARFEQVMLNLLSNAKDALEDKHKKTTSDNMPGQIRISTSSEREHLIVKVWDNGTGISSANLDKIFNPFFSTKPEGKGTGLGLPIVYGIISEMKGEISVSTEEGNFTEISIKLPQYLKKMK